MQKIHAQSFRDLIVYQKTKSVSRIIYELSKTFPREETYKFCNSDLYSIREEVSDYVTSRSTDH